MQIFAKFKVNKNFEVKNNIRHSNKIKKYIIQNNSKSFYHLNLDNQIQIKKNSLFCG